MLQLHDAQEAVGRHEPVEAALSIDHGDAPATGPSGAARGRLKLLVRGGDYRDIG